MNLYVVFGVFLLAWIASPPLTNDAEWRNMQHGYRLIGLAIMCAIPALLLGRGFA